MQKSWKMAETLANGYSPESTQWELSNEYQHDSISVVIKNLCIFVFWAKVASAQECKDFWKPSKPSHVGIHWIALTEYFQMRTHVSGFPSFFMFFASFCIGQITLQQHMG